MLLRHGLAFSEAIPMQFRSDQFLKHMRLILNKHIDKAIWVVTLQAC